MTTTSPAKNGDIGPFRLIFSREFRPSLFVCLSILAGNLGYYYTRAYWSVVQPELKKDGIIDNGGYSIILQATYIVNMIGKPFGGFIIDYTNKPKWNFVFFLLLSASVAVAATFVPTFYGVIIFWTLTRFVTSIGRMSVIKLMAAWWPRFVMGTVMGIVTVSCSAGEGLARLSLSQSLFIISWREVIYMAAGMAVFSILPTIFLVHDVKKGGFEDDDDMSDYAQNHQEMVSSKSEKVELAEPVAAYMTSSTEKRNRSSVSPPSSKNDVGVCTINPTSAPAGVNTATSGSVKLSFTAKCALLFVKPRFIILCLSCLCTNIIREIICAHSINFLKDVLGLHSGTVGTVTALFSSFSAFSSFLGGRLMDHVPRRHHGLVNMLYSSGLVVFITTVYLCMIMNPVSKEDPDLQTKIVRIVSLMTCAEFFLGPPVSFLDGLFVIDLVNHEQVSFTSGAIGCIGYIGPFFAAFYIGAWTTNGNWELVWLLCLVSSIVQLGLSFAYWFFDRLNLKKKHML